jgi:hypothetical protein
VTRDCTSTASAIAFILRGIRKRDRRSENSEARSRQSQLRDSKRPSVVGLIDLATCTGVYDRIAARPRRRHGVRNAREKDPIGFDGGDTNLFAYTVNDPVNLSDPSGVPFGGTIDAGESYGEAALSYADMLTDPNATGYEKAGAAGGGAFSALWTPCTSDSTFAVLTTAAGGAGGLRAAGSKAAGKEFSHWIPDRVLKRSGSQFLRNTFGTSRANGNYVTPMRHYLHDPHRMLRGTTRSGKFPPVGQQLDRVPRVYYGAGGGAAVGGAALASGSGCGCQ